MKKTIASSKLFGCYAVLLCVVALGALQSVLAEELVCGHTADSSQGYGQVIIEDLVISCNNMADGLCPEDFENASGVPANCSSCTDPDCTGTVVGTVHSLNGGPIMNAKIMSNPIRYDQSATLDTSTMSAYDGRYNLTAPTGTYYVSASAEGFDTELTTVTVTRNRETTQEFNLANGTCHADCTNYYGRCNAACDGVILADGENCTFADVDTKSLCNNRLKGVNIFYGILNDSYANFVECCEGVPQPQYYAPAKTSAGVATEVIQMRKVAVLDGTPVELRIAVWRK